MNFLEKVEVNPKISLKKGKVYPFIEMSNVGVYNREPSFIDKKPFLSGVKFEDGDTVVARITPCLQNGKGFYCHGIGKGFGSTEYLVFRPKNDSVDNRYLYYFMQSNYVRESMIKSMVGSTGRQRVNNDVFTRIDVDFPEIAVQKKIANILSVYDDLIENSQKQIKLLEEAAQRLYKEWFIDLHFPGCEETEVVDGVPEGWKKTDLQEISKFVRGKTITKKDIIEGDIPVVAGGLGPAYYHSKAITEAPVITVSGSGANAGFTRMYYQKIWASDCSYIDAKRTDYIYFTFCFLKDNKKSLGNLQKGSAQPHVYAKDINTLALKCPPEYILKSFEDIVAPIFRKIACCIRSIEMSQQARDRLLPKLMSGELEV